ncbi:MULTISPECIES: hypothetical protein [Kocuria]|jgi:hypothetical protein|uniref:hypothetical protein n=1 Tax=Kocuria TaxID=57493 RepID=UPI002040C406|nr:MULTISPECIES: hypothetical protein [Kocuria]MCM3687121.1 hypothetical protein [Kocuria rosea]HST71863.1 hypothetical protein [Kocuria rosea]
MSELHVAPAAADAGQCETCLAPECAFPAELGALTLVELQVLHSRIACQLDHEYLDNPDGPHPVTQDRHEELLAELESRTRAD